MERLLEFLISVDNKLLDVLFQPIVALSPERTRAKPAMIGFLFLLANAIFLIVSIVMKMFDCHVPGLPWCWSRHITPEQEVLTVLVISSWIGMASGNHYLMQLCANLCKEQRSGMANWFRVGGFIFRYSFLIGAIVISLWGSQTGPVFWLWWAGTCFMGCNSMPPREPFWLKLRQWAHA